MHKDSAFFEKCDNSKGLNSGSTHLKSLLGIRYVAPDCIFRKIQLSISDNPANILMPDFAFLLYFCSMIRFGFGRFGKNHICTYMFQYLHFFF